MKIVFNIIVGLIKKAFTKLMALITYMAKYMQKCCSKKVVRRLSKSIKKFGQKKGEQVTYPTLVENKENIQDTEEKTYKSDSALKIKEDDQNE